MNGSFGPITVASLFLLTIVPPCDMDGASLGKMQALAPSKDEGPVEGPIAIARPPHKSARHGPARTKVVRVWTHGKGEHPWIQDWEKAHFDDKPLLRLQIGDTPYSLLLVGGRIAPLIATNTGVWRLEGLEKEFELVSGMHVTGKGVELITSGGDMRSIYKLEFAPGLVVQYWEEYDGP